MDHPHVPDESGAQRRMEQAMRKLRAEVDALTQAAPRGPWWVQALLGVLLTGAIGYIGMVHTMALGNRAEIQAVRSVQDKASRALDDVEDLKRRLLAAEERAGQIPLLQKQLESVGAKLDRLLERSRP